MSSRYSQEFKDRAVRLFTDSRENYSSETEALHGVAKNLNVAPESLRRWREQADEKAVSTPEESEELKKLRREVVELRRANEILQTASAFFASRLNPTGR
jgi:transposase